MKYGALTGTSLICTGHCLSSDSAGISGCVWVCSFFRGDRKIFFAMFPGHPVKFFSGVELVWVLASILVRILFLTFAFMFASTAASSKAAASLSIKEMAFVGHTGRQFPSPSQ